MNINNNCEPCNTTPGAPVNPAPTCPTPACEELTPTECVINNLLDDGCTSYLYQYDQDTGALIIDPQTNAPTPIVDANGQPEYPLGLTIQSGQNLNTILTNLVDAQNCAFNPNFIAGMLQVIQANPNHPVSQIFCNLVCACACDDECQITQVEQVVFNPIDTNHVTMTWFAIPGYTYDFTFTNTSTIPSEVSQILNFSVPVGSVPIGGGEYTLDTSTLPDTPDLVNFPLDSGASYQLTITANFQGASCDSITWFFNTATSLDCECPDVVIQITAEPGAPLDALAFNIVCISCSTVPPSSVIPIEYIVEVQAGSTFPNPGDVVFGPSQYAYAGATTPVCFGCAGGIVGGEYVVYVTPVCSENPDCFGTQIFETITVAGPLTCDVPDIVSISSNP